MVSGTRRVRALVAGVLALVAVLVSHALVSPQAAHPAPAQALGTGEVYIALGDSYTSGPLVPNQHGQPIDCGRSDRNYPSLIAAEFEPETFIDVSCGSAQTKHMTEPQTDLPAGGTNPPQFNALRADATLVTIGIGGNDAGLVGVAEKCAQLGLTDPNGTSCRDFYAPGGNDTVTAKIEATRPKIATLLQTIHERSPLARVAIVGYPDVLPEQGNCYPMVPLSPDDVRYIDELILRINDMISEVAATNGADYVDTYADSGGHDVCRLPPQRWFEGLVPTEPAYPLHPNAKGLASMGRSAIAVLSKPSKRGPELTRLRLDPRRVERGRTARLRFRLDSTAIVTVKIRPAGKQGKAGRGGKGRQTFEAFATAGTNRVKLRPKRLPTTPGRYRVTALPTGDNGLPGATDKARFRIVRGAG